MMDLIEAEHLLSKYREAEGNSGEMQTVCNTALLWLRELHDAHEKIDQLRQELDDAIQAQFVFMKSGAA